MGPKSGWGGDRLRQTRLIPRSPDGDKKVMDLKLANLGQSELWYPWHPGLQGPGLG